MRFEIQSVGAVEENVGFRVIGCLVSENETEYNEYLPAMCESMKEIIGAYAKDVMPAVADNDRGDFVEKTIVYRAISLPELAFVINQLNKSLDFKITVHLSDDVKMYPESISEIFKFQLDCFKQQNDL